MTMQKNNNLLFLILALLYGIILAWIFCYQVPNIKLYSSKCVRAQDDITKSQEMLNQSPAIKTFYMESQSDTEKANSLFADKEAPLVFISFLEKLAGESDVTIQISPAGNAGKDYSDIFDFFALQTTLTGESKNILKFVEKLENSPYLLSLQSLNILKSTDAKTGKGQASAVITLKVYAKK